MVAAAFHAALTDIDSTAQVPLGAIYETDNKRYKYVRFSGTTAIAIGDFLSYVVAGSDGAEVIVDKASTALGAGAAVAAVPSGAVAFGYIQISGLCVLSGAPAGSPAFGDNLTSAGAAAGGVTKNAAANTATVGQFYTGNTVILDCLN
jgi:hypothetical protein